MCGAGPPAVLHDGNNAGRALLCRHRPFTPLSLQRLAHIFRIWSKTLSDRHYAVDVKWEAFGAWGAWWAGWD